MKFVGRKLFPVSFLQVFILLSFTLMGTLRTMVEAGEEIEVGKTYFGGKEESEEDCQRDGGCQSKPGSGQNKKTKQKCQWGYEPGCTDPENWFIKPVCDKTIGYTRKRWNNFEEKLLMFWKETDFGLVKGFKEDVSPVCVSTKETESSLACNSELGYCVARNLYMDLRDDGRMMEERFRNKAPFTNGQFGGKCILHRSEIEGKDTYRMELTSWLTQLEQYTNLPFNPMVDGHCDVVVDKPVFFMKLDAVVSMYHHFCDFFNLYITQHVNGSFDTDVYIILWEGYARRGLGNFSPTWKAFTQHPVMYLGHQYRGQRVCFKHAVFSLLPRMVFGLYYNTPIMPGCRKSGLFKAFSEHVLGRLGVHQERKQTEKDQPIRVTLLSRQTKWRRILNEDELVHQLTNWPGVKFEIAKYTWSDPFVDQLQLTHNSDVFIGMHGAGLAHALFLPDWAVLFELYNCEDDGCYKDLAHIRGLNYITWENKNKIHEYTEELHPTYSDNPKFRNYAFEVKEFMRLVQIAVDQVKRNLGISS